MDYLSYLFMPWVTSHTLIATLYPPGMDFPKLLILLTDVLESLSIDDSEMYFKDLGWGKDYLCKFVSLIYSTLSIFKDNI